MRLNIDRELKSFRLMQGSMDRIGLGLETLENLGSIRTKDPWSKEETNELKLNAIKKRVREVKIPFTSGNAIRDFKSVILIQIRNSDVQLLIRVTIS